MVKFSGLGQHSQLTEAVRSLWPGASVEVFQLQYDKSWTLFRPGYLSLHLGVNYKQAAPKIRAVIAAERCRRKGEKG